MENNKCLCIGSCIQFDIWEEKFRKSSWKIRMSFPINKGKPVCQATGHIITKEKPKSK